MPAFHTELERKWLVAVLPALDSTAGVAYTQAYLGTTADGLVKRIRDKGGRYIFEMKGEGTAARAESDPVKITRADFERQLAEREGRLVMKTRYAIQLEGGLIAELDLFERELSGLVVVEVEFESQQQMESFVAPAWFGREVTEDPSYQNRTLSKNGIPESYTPPEFYGGCSEVGAAYGSIVLPLRNP